MNNQNQTNNDNNITPAALLEQLVYVDTFMPEIDDPSQLDERLTAELSAFADDSFIFPDEEKPQINDSDSNGNGNANGNANGNNRGVSGNSNNSSGGFNMNKYALLNSSQKNLNNNNNNNNNNNSNSSSNNTNNISHLNHISPTSTASTTSTATANSIAPNDILSNLPKVPVPPGAHSSLLAAGLSQTQIDALAALIAQHQGVNQNNSSNTGLNGINLSNLGSNAVNSAFGGNNNNSGNANGNLQLLNGLGLNNNQNQNQIQQNGGNNGNNISNIVRLQQEMALRKFQGNNNSNTNSNTSSNNNSNTQLNSLLSGNNGLSFPLSNATSTALNSSNTANNTNNATGTSSAASGAASGTSSLASSILSSSTLALLNAQNSNNSNSRKNSNSGTANNRSNSISDTFTNIDPQQHGASPDDPSQRFEPTGDTETDKRRRNTAASARFRIKKKLKEQQLERSVRELNELTISLEQKIQTLQMENKLLRNLVVEKSEVRNQEEVELLRMKAKMDGNNGMGF